MITNIEKFVHYLGKIDYTPHVFRMNITLMIQEIKEQLVFINTEEIPNLIEMCRNNPNFHIVSEKISNKIRVLENISEVLESLITA